VFFFFFSGKNTLFFHTIYINFIFQTKNFPDKEPNFQANLYPLLNAIESL